MPVVRRHIKGAGHNQHAGPQVQTVSGNYVAAKRKGVVNGVDLGYTGMVRCCLGTRIVRAMTACL